MMAGSLIVDRAGPDDLEVIVPLFDAYRVFYGQESDQDRARAYLAARFVESDSVIFLARRDGVAAGFIQMYPSFSSVRTSRIWILNDLFVDASARRSGAAQALMEFATDWARESGALGLVLETAADNEPASTLYEKLGWKLQSDFKTYQLEF